MRRLIIALVAVSGAGCGGHSINGRDGATDAGGGGDGGVTVDAAADGPADAGGGDGDAAADGSAPDGAGCPLVTPANEYPSAFTLRAIESAGQGMFGDVDGDGLLDEIGWDTLPNPLAFSVFRNDGTGAFLPAVPRSADVSIPAIGVTLSSLFVGGIGDFDGDGRADAALLAYDSPAATYRLMPFRGNPDGTLTPVDAANVWRPANAPVFIPIGTADVNGDGGADLSFWNVSGGAIAVGVYLGTQQGLLKTSPVTTATGLMTTDSTTVSAAAGDIDHDGRADLIVRYKGQTGDHSAFLRANADGSFQAPLDLPNVPADTPATSGVAVGHLWLHDVDGDGDADVLTASDRLFHSNGDGTFTERPSPFTGSPITAAAFGDFDGDGHGDVVVQLPSGLGTAYGDGAGAFSRVESSLRNGVPFAGNFDGRGATDLALHQDGTVVLLGHGAQPMACVTPQCTDGLAIDDRCVHFDGPALGPADTCLQVGGCFGDGTAGQLGDGREVSSLTPISPVLPPPQPNFIALVPGDGFTCMSVLNVDAALNGVYCWGRNDHGQLGDGTMTDSLTPVAVQGIPADELVGPLIAGEGYACVLAGGGHLLCWGRNDQGQLGDGTTTDRPTAADVGLPSMLDARAGRAHTCVLTSTGLVCWGRNVEGQLGDGTTAPYQTRPVSVKTGAGAALTPDKISVGGSHTCALNLLAKTAYCWGSNAHGQLARDPALLASTNVPTAILGSDGSVLLADEIEAGADHTCLLPDDTYHLPLAQCWGANAHGQLGDGTTVERFTPAPVIGPASAIMDTLLSGWDHTCARLVDNLRLGTISNNLCWGRNQDGELGKPPGQDLLVPTPF